MTERIIGNISERRWEFPQPTVLIESQSAPALAGAPVEQKYMRAFVLAKETDLVVTDFLLNEVYISQYLKGVLGFQLPEFIVVPDSDKGTLSGNILSNSESQDKILNWTKKWGDSVKVQFFNITSKEKELLNVLKLPSTSGNIDGSIEVGSKTGFRRFSNEYGLPMARGYICSTIKETALALENIFQNSNKALIKSENGTGGTDLKSNIVFSKEEINGGTLDDLILTKLAELDGFLGNEWVIEEFVEGNDGSVHVYINDCFKTEKPFVLGAISQDNSYVGGYWPSQTDEKTKTLIDYVSKVAVPNLQKLGVYGYHCFDFKGSKFLEDNTRPGALDFIDGFVGRISKHHFPNEKYSYYHMHVPISRPTTFNEVWSFLHSVMNPANAGNGKFLVVSNPEVLPFGRSLDLTAVCFGPTSSLDSAKQYFEVAKNYVQSIL